MTSARGVIAAVFLVACQAAPPAAAPPAAPPPASSAKPPADVPNPTRWPDVSLPRSTATHAVTMGIPTIVVSKTDIHLEGEPSLVPLPADRSRGIDAKYKRAGEQHGLHVPLLGDALLAKKANDAALVFDATTPYRVVTEVMFTTGQSEIAKLHLVVVRDGALAEIPITPPRVAKPSEPPPDLARQLSFVVLLVRDGISLKTRGANIAPGCKGMGPGIAIPKKNGAHDLDGLRACATLLRESNPEASEDRGVIVTATAEVPYGELVQALDRVREGSRGEPLFPEIVFGIAR